MLASEIVGRSQPARTRVLDQQPRFAGEELSTRQRQEEQDRLSNVSEMLTDKLIRDDEATKLGRTLQEMDRATGQDPRHYRGLKTAEHLFARGGKHGNVLQKGKKRMFPERLLHRIQTLREENFMFGGLLPEIHRAWISIDHVLYLWNYNDGQQYEVYDALDQLIITVALVRAREGVFLERTDWLLVVTTPTEVVVLALLFETPSDYDGALRLRVPPLTAGAAALTGSIPAKSRLVLQPTGPVSPAGGRLTVGCGDSGVRVVGQCNDAQSSWDPFGQDFHGRQRRVPFRLESCR